MTGLAGALSELDEKLVNSLLEESITRGAIPLEIIRECQAGMEEVGRLFAEKTYFLSELIYAAHIFNEIMQKINPLEKTHTSVLSGKVVIGTVRGDIHDIGKNIVVSLLKGSGFEVTDLGVDVPGEKFIEALKKSGAKIIGMSALLSSAFSEMKSVVDLLNDAGVREKVTVIVGGGLCDETVRRFTGADYCVNDAVRGIEICRMIYGFPAS